MTDFNACYSRRRETEFESIRIPFVGLEDLIKTKESGREKGQADLKALKEIDRERKRNPERFQGG